MRIHALVLLLVSAIVAQSCWAIGESLHTHGPQQTPLTTTSLYADLHYDDLHDPDRSQPSEAEWDHHHSCVGHSPFALLTSLVSAAVMTEVFTRLGPILRAPDVTSEGIDRPNWRSPA